MHYEYDLWGWYIAEHPIWRERCTTLAPSRTDMPEEPGATRCLWAGNGWIERPYEKPPLLPETPQQPDPRHISPLALRRRFTLAERSAIEWAAVDRADTSEKQRKDAALLRACLKDQEQAGFIDLDDADVATGVRLIEELQLIAPGRASEILGAPVQPGERA
jgi:hypothetical protein